MLYKQEIAAFLSLCGKNHVYFSFGIYKGCIYIIDIIIEIE